MKKYIILSFVIALSLGVSIATAKNEPNGGPFQALWNAVAYLQEQIDNIELIPGPQGLQGEKGDKGDPGEDAAHGAGNIAFIDDEQGIPVMLKIDGTVWRYTGNPGTWVNYPALTVPIPTSDIVQWESNDVFLDKDGNVWIFGGPPWINTGKQ